MYKYLEEILSLVELPDVDENEIVQFRNSVIKSMKDMGANDNQIDLLGDDAIKYAIINQREPLDLAWTLLQ